MTTLTVTARGQVTFKKDVLKHLGIKPGGKIVLELLPSGKASLSGEPAGTIDGFLGILAGKSKKIATVEEMNEATRAGWAGQQ